MGDGGLTPTFEQCLLGLRTGRQRGFTLARAKTFGPLFRQLIYHLDRAQTAMWAKVPAPPSSCSDQPNGGELPGIIRAVEGMSVTVDFNHPWPVTSSPSRWRSLGVDDEEKVH